MSLIKWRIADLRNYLGHHRAAKCFYNLEVLIKAILK